MALRDELMIEASAKTHIGDICGRAADELIIKEMKIKQQEREIDRLREQMEMARRRVDAMADQMLEGKADGGLLGGRHLKRAVPGIFGIRPE